MFNNVRNPSHACVMMVWVAGMLFCVVFLVGMSVMEVVVIMVIVVVAMFVMIMVMLLCMVMYMLMQIHIHALLFLSVDRHLHMRSGDPALHSRFCLNRKSRQTHLIHCL